MSEPPVASRFRMVASPRSAAAQRRRREHELRHALASGELTLSFAPILSLASGTIGAAEAIVRWPHRRRGLVPVADVLPLAETSALATQIGGWVLQKACKCAASWQSGAAICIDVVSGHLDQDGLLEQVAQALASAGLPAERLELEVSETDLAQCLDEHLLRLAALRDHGVGVTLDGFGAGAASLTLLKRMPLTAVKFDASLLRDLPASREDWAILHASIQAALALGLHTIAAGVETEDQRAALAGMGCHAGQGPLFGPAFAADWPGAV